MLKVTLVRREGHEYAIVGVIYILFSSVKDKRKISDYIKKMKEMK